MKCGTKEARARQRSVSPVVERLFSETEKKRGGFE